MGKFKKVFSSENEKLKSMPSILDVTQNMEKIIQACQGSKKHSHPLVMPFAPTEGAEWFLKLIDPQRNHERLRERKAVNGNSYWDWPYQDRVYDSLKKFLNANEDMQALIFAARQDNIYWRGDSLEMFALIVEETEKLTANGIVEYKKESIKKIKQSIMKMNAGNV